MFQILVVAVIILSGLFFFSSVAMATMDAVMEFLAEIAVVEITTAAIF